MNGFLQHYGLIILATVIVLTFVVFASIFGSTISDHVESMLVNFFNKTTVEEEVCEHNETITKDANSNYSGDTVCKECGKVQEKGMYLGEHDVVIYTNDFTDYDVTVKYSLDGEKYNIVNNSSGTVTIPNLNEVWIDITWTPSSSMAVSIQDESLTSPHITKYIDLEDTAVIKLVEKAELLTFTFTGSNNSVNETYQFEEGMTWEEFVDSEYNTGNKFRTQDSDGSYGNRCVRYGNSQAMVMIVKGTTSSSISAGDTIVKNATYKLSIAISGGGAV